jgi:hypothetical protein
MVGHAAYPCPDGVDSAEAEAYGSAKAVLMTAELRTRLVFDDVEFQGDNTSAVGFWNGTTRFRGLRIQHILE